MFVKQSKYLLSIGYTKTYPTLMLWYFWISRVFFRVSRWTKAPWEVAPEVPLTLTLTLPEVHFSLLAVQGWALATRGEGGRRIPKISPTCIDHLWAFKERVSRWLLLDHFEIEPPLWCANVEGKKYNTIFKVKTILLGTGFRPSSHHRGRHL
jgi:hypothetical protein